jgi:glucose-1-phosphate thymidylyltransferase
LKITKAVILAAGKGTRLLPLTRAIPKEMIRIGTKPIIEHVIDFLRTGGIEEILIIIGRKKEQIMDHLGSGKAYGVDISYKIQEDPRGTADATYYARNFVGEDCFVLIYGDNYFKPFESIIKFLNFHINKKKAEATIVLHPVEDPTRFGLVNIDDQGKILKLIEKPTMKEAKDYLSDGKYLSIAGLLILNHSVFSYIKQIEKGIGNELWLTDAIELMRQDNREMFGYVYQGTRYDIGTFQSLLEADSMEQRESKLMSKRKK